jgi:hypothetical protein
MTPLEKSQDFGEVKYKTGEKNCELAGYKCKV